MVAVELGSSPPQPHFRAGVVAAYPSPCDGRLWHGARRRVSSKRETYRLGTSPLCAGGGFGGGEGVEAPETSPPIGAISVCAVRPDPASGAGQPANPMAVGRRCRFPSMSASSPLGGLPRRQVDRTHRPRQSHLHRTRKRPVPAKVRRLRRWRHGPRTHQRVSSGTIAPWTRRGG